MMINYNLKKNKKFIFIIKKKILMKLKRLKMLYTMERNKIYIL